MPRTLACLAVAAALVCAVPRARAVLQEERGGKHEEHDTELAQKMEHVEDLLKAVRKHSKDPATYPDALAALVEIERTTLACKDLAPELAGKLPEAERGAMVKDYRKTMVEFLTHQLELETALLDADPERVKAAFERVRGMEDPAHEKFAPEDG